MRRHPLMMDRPFAQMAVMLLGVVFLLGCSGETAEAPEEPAPTEEPAAAPTAAPEDPFAGTAWRLVEFQSMDDSVGTIQPDDPSAFTMRFADDGTVALELDCNQATANYSASPSESGTSGTFTLGPLAMTRALCEPPNLDERIATDAEYIRTFLLRDGNLHLSLMADGGTYTWEPLEEQD